MPKPRLNFPKIKQLGKSFRIMFQQKVKLNQKNNQVKLLAEFADFLNLII